MSVDWRERFIEEGNEKIKYLDMASREISKSNVNFNNCIYRFKSFELEAIGYKVPPQHLMVFLLVDLLKCESHFKEMEKVFCEIHFKYKEIECCYSIRKFDTYIYTDSNDTDFLKSLMRTLWNLGKIADNLLEKPLEKSVDSGQVIIKNSSYRLFSRYEYFKSKAIDSYSKEGIKSERSLINKIQGLSTEGFYNTTAMLEAYFSFQEHVLVLLFAFQKNEVSLKDFIELTWQDKFKIIFDIKDKKIHRYYNALVSIKNNYRNPIAHGGFDKSLDYMLVYIEGLGYVPTNLNDGHFYTRLSKSETLEEIINTIDKFHKWINDTQILSRKMKIIESGLDIKYTTLDFETYNEALESDDKLEQYLDYAVYAWEREINMDW